MLQNDIWKPILLGIIAFTIIGTVEGSINELLPYYSWLYGLWAIFGIPIWEEAVKLKVLRRLPTFYLGLAFVFTFMFIEACHQSINPFTGQIAHVLFLRYFLTIPHLLFFFIMWHFRYNWEGYVFATSMHFMWNLPTMLVRFEIIKDPTFYVNWAYGMQLILAFLLFIWILYNEDFTWREEELEIEA